MLALAAFLSPYLVLETTHLYTTKLSTFQFPITTPPRTQKGKREREKKHPASVDRVNPDKEHVEEKRVPAGIRITAWVRSGDKDGLNLRLRTMCT